MGLFRIRFLISRDKKLSYATHGSNTEDKDEKGRVVRKERVSGSYSRSFYVGEGIHQEDIKASFDNGELKIVVPKEAPKQVEEDKFIPIE